MRQVKYSDMPINRLRTKIFIYRITFVSKNDETSPVNKGFQFINSYQKSAMSNRLVKILFSCSIALFTFVVCFNNVFNYRILTHNLLYILIITGEIFIAVLILIGSVRMIKNLEANADEFKNAKRYTSIGLSFGILLWLTIFIAVSGKWLLMWQSKTWNAQYIAFSLTGCFLLFLIHHKREDN